MFMEVLIDVFFFLFLMSYHLLFQCHENMEIKKKTEEGLGIEYDEDIVCEICRSVS